MFASFALEIKWMKVICTLKDDIGEGLCRILAMPNPFAWNNEIQSNLSVKRPPVLRYYFFLYL